MPACLRETAGSASTTVLPATEPMVVTSSVSCSVWFAIGPRMNSSRATGAQPQNRHFVHTGSITRRQFPHSFCGPRLPRFATTTSTTSRTSAMPTISPISAPVDMTLADRLELEVRLAERDHVVVHEIVLLHAAIVDVAAIRRTAVEQREARRRCRDLT